MESNYEKQVFIARDLFLHYDQNEMIQKFQLVHDECYLYLRMLDTDYRISRTEGYIECRVGRSTQTANLTPVQAETDEQIRKGFAEQLHAEADVQPHTERGQDSGQYVRCLNYHVVMIIYDVLCYSKKLPTLAHEWCPLYALQVTMSSPGTDTFTCKYAKLFSAKIDSLRRACQRMGGTRPAVAAGADVCWQFAVFAFFPVQMRFWDGDEEFEPKIQFLWDRNTLDFMHFETTYYAMGHLLECLVNYVEAENERDYL